MRNLIALLTLIEEQSGCDSEICKSVQSNASNLRTHKHKCNHCGYIWRHTEACAGDKEAHTCDKCGEAEYLRYRGPEE